MQSQQNKNADTQKAADDKSGKIGKGGVNGKQSVAESPPNRPAIRPAPTNDSERLTHLAAALQQQQETIKTREKEIGVREKQMDILHDNIKKEQKKLEITRKEIQAELVQVQEKLDQLERRTADSEKDRRAVDVQKKDLERNILEMDSQEWTNLKQQIKTIEKMDPEAASIVLVQMVDSGKLDTAAKILSQMRDRQAAAIFAEIAKQDTKLPAQLFERLLSLKTPQVAAPK
jgi:flagellar motility protein MotE (MotC chaperone)